ncbi:MAG TPA: gamma-glutamylcyclotransferase family protein [Bordetella sp.]
MTEDRDVWLFSYGTLQLESVQLESFGRLLGGEDDAMIGYSQAMVEITDPEVIRQSGQTFHPIVAPTGNTTDEVVGKVFRITREELAAADRYEVSDYQRVLVPLKSGKQAWVYVRA